MEFFEELMAEIYKGFQHTVTIYGHEISLWMIFMFTLVGGIICKFIGDLINGE